METRTYKVYKFGELSEEQQAKVLEHYYDINVDYEWWDSTYEDAKTVGLKVKGFDLGRGSNCEMDYIDDACFTAHKIMKEHGEKCDTYIDAVAFLKERDEIVNTAERDEAGEFVDEWELDQHLDEVESEFLRTLSEDYRIMLQNEHEYLTSEGAIKETIEANDYDFTEDGKID